MENTGIDNVTEGDLLAEQRGHVGVLTFNRPKQHNALTPSLLLSLCDVLGKWAASGEVRVVVLTGAGNKAFSAGYDIRSIETVGPEHGEEIELGVHKTPFEQALNAVKNFPYPTIAMINGYCFGGALHMALCCDLRVGANSIAMGMPPAKLGVVYAPDGVTQFISVLGAAKAREMFFTGRTYKGNDIVTMGLVGQLVAAGQLKDTVLSLAEEIAGNAPLALKGIKRIMNLLEQPALSREDEAEADALVAESFSSADLKEGQAAFLERRKPVFLGE